MSREIRVWREGELRWVEASGTGVNAWQTASAVPASTGTGYNTAAWAARSGTIGYVRAGLSFDETWNYATVSDRGLPKHHKYQGKEPVETTFEILFGITADMPSANTAVGPSALGVSRVAYNFELKMREEEVATASGIYYQFHKSQVLRRGLSESEDGDTMGFTVRSLDTNGPTGSGYLG